MRMSIKRFLVLLVPAVFVVGIGAAAPAQAAMICTNVYRLQASNGYYVAAEEGLSQYNGMLRARTPGNALGTWEEFAVYEITGAPGIVQFALKAHNGKFVDTFWNSYTGHRKGMLRASASTANYNDQRFNLPYNTIVTGEPRTFKSSLNHLNVANEQNYTGSEWGMLRARTPDSEVGSWEQFTWHYVRDC